jgi:serine/threonine protein kinase
VQEARAASSLNHPGVITIYDIDTSEGETFIAMELVEGKTLGQLNGRNLPDPAACSAGRRPVHSSGSSR